MFKIKVFFLTASLVFLGVPFVFAEEKLSFSQKEIADLVSPSVVKIIQKVKGEAKVPAFKIDFTNLTVGTEEGEETIVPIDDYFFGSGFIVSPDGYIMTNSHVVSYQTVKNLIASDFILPAVSEGFQNLNEDNLKQLEEKKEEMAKFGEKIVDYVLEKSKFEIEKTVVVLRPGSKKEDSESLFEEGYPAKIVSVNDDFFKDNKDVALIKIEENNLPSVKIGKSEDISTGSKVFIMGYPSTAELNNKTLLNSSFTEGVVSALKDSIDRSFKIIETDAKISKGSSGGPLVNEMGEVVGLVTFITSGTSKEDGDSFAFAVPIDITGEVTKTKMLNAESPPPLSEGEYSKNFLKGLFYFEKKRCKEANSYFQKAKESNNEKFSVARFLDPYQKNCQKLIDSGESVDGKFEVFLDEMKDSKKLIIFGLGFGLISFVLGSYYTYNLRKKIKEEEEELDNVERYLNLSLEDGKPLKKKK